MANLTMNQLPNPGRCRRSAIQLVAVEARWRCDGHRRNPHRVGRNRLCWSITRARPRRCLLGCLDGNGCSAPVTAATIERSRLCDHYSMRSYCSALQRSSARMPPRIRLERIPSAQSPIWILSRWAGGLFFVSVVRWATVPRRQLLASVSRCNHRPALHLELRCRQWQPASTTCAPGWLRWRSVKR